MKRLTILILCAPILFVIFVESERIIRLELAGNASMLDGAAQAKLENDLKVAQENARKLRVSEDSQRTAFQAVEELHRNTADGELGEAINAHGRALAGTRRFLEGHKKIDAGGTISDLKIYGKTSAEYQKLLENYKDLVALEERINRLVSLPPDSDDLQNIERYLALGGSRRRYERGRALMDEHGIKSKHIEIPRELEAVLAVKGEGDSSKARARVSSFDRDLEKFIKDHPNENQWAKREHGKWEQLLENIEKENTRAPEEVLKRYGQLCEEGAAFSRFPAGPSAKFQTLVRKAAARFGDAYLPRRLALDTQVNVGQGSEELVERKLIEITWKDPSRAREPLANYDEFTLPEGVKEFIINMSEKGKKGKNVPRITPTRRSQAAHSYNQCRHNLKWITPSINELFKHCERHKDDLGDTWDRIDKVHGTAADFSELFADN